MSVVRCVCGMVNVLNSRLVGLLFASVVGLCSVFV